MIKSPKSLTATVHVRFHYDDTESKPLQEGQTEIIAKILDQAADMDPKLQEILVEFANYLSEKSPTTEG